MPAIVRKANTPSSPPSKPSATSKAAPARSNADRYGALLKRVQNIDFGGGGGFWKAPEGRSIVRILPPVGSMEFFFVEVGQHYLGGNTPISCPAITTGGQQPCPICEINEALYANGEKEGAKKFRAARSWLMNIVDRAAPDKGVQILSAGQMIFSSVVVMIQDPDVGDISDPVSGYDIKIDRSGEAKDNTRYQAKEAKNPSPLNADAAQAEEWLASAKDLQAYALEGLLSYDDLIKRAGISHFFEDVQTTPTTQAEEEDEEEELQEDDDEEEEQPKKSVSGSASNIISERMKQRAANIRR